MWGLLRKPNSIIMDGDGDGKYKWKCLNKKEKAEIKVLTIPDIRFYSSSDSSKLQHEKRSTLTWQNQKQSNYQHLQTWSIN